MDFLGLIDFTGMRERENRLRVMVCNAKRLKEMRDMRNLLLRFSGLGINAHR